MAERPSSMAMQPVTKAGRPTRSHSAAMFWRGVELPLGPPTPTSMVPSRTGRKVPLVDRQRDVVHSSVTTEQGASADVPVTGARSVGAPNRRGGAAVRGMHPGDELHGVGEPAE